MTINLPTLIFQIVNFLVLSFLLWKLLWKPLRAHMQQRSTGIQRDLLKIQQGQEEVARLKVEAEQALEKARQIEQEAINHAKLEADAKKVELLQEAQKRQVKNVIEYWRK